LHGWIKRSREKQDNPFPGSGKLSDEDAKFKSLEKENRELREELEILKKAAVYFAKNLK
jgi:transposase